MSNPAVSIVSRINDDIESLIEEQASYFRQFVGRCGLLIKASADVVRKGDRELRGVKFPIGLIVEALKECEKRKGMLGLTVLRLELQDHLAKSYAESGFHYFNETYLPEDLDTASTLARLLGHENVKLHRAYDEIISRNQLPRRIVPTWLDTSEHARWFAGAYSFHMDVLLNHWLAELDYCRPVDEQILYETVNTYGLRNYWYLPPLYTPYLYCRLIRRMGLNRELRFLLPVMKVVKLWDQDPKAYQRCSNVCSYEKMEKLLAEQPVLSRLDAYLRRAISVCCGDALSLSESHEFADDTTGWRTPLYWSLGFSAFVSEPVNRSIALLSLVEFD